MAEKKLRFKKFNEYDYEIRRHDYLVGWIWAMKPGGYGFQQNTKPEPTPVLSANLLDEIAEFLRSLPSEEETNE